MNERDSPVKPKVTFGIRVPNSGPLASPESIVPSCPGSRITRLRFHLGSRPPDLDGRDSPHSHLFGIRRFHDRGKSGLL